MRVESKIVVALALSLLAVGNANADRSELRLSLGGDFAYSKAQVFDGEGTNYLHGGHGSAAYGIFDSLDVAGSVGILPAKTASIDEASVNGEGGAPGFTAFTTLRLLQISLGFRAYADIGPFLRLRPFVGASGGAQLTRFSDPELFFGDASVITGEADWNVEFLKTVEIGISYRLSDRFLSAIVANASVTNTMTLYGISFEFSWMH